MNWLERARREIPNTPHNGTVKTDVTEVSAVMAVPHRGNSEISIHGDDLAANIREHFEERAAILEYDAGLPREQAELEAARMVATHARNLGCSWAILRAALSGYPALLALIPDRHGSVDFLPLGVSRFAVLPGRGVVR